MFSPIEPPAGPQSRGYSDGPNGSTSFLSPGLGQLARGNVPYPVPAQHNNVLQQLIQHLTQLQQGNGQTHPRMHPLQPGGDVMVEGDDRDNLVQNLNPHFNQVHMAQALAQLLAGQHTAGLRRFSGR